MPLHRINNKVILFVHIPKTGGSTMETWLENLGPRALKYPGKYAGLLTAPQHFHAALIERIIPEDFYDDAFCIVRDPLERLTSEYRWAFRKRQTAPLRGFRYWRDKDVEAARTRHFAKWVRQQIAKTAKDPLTRGNHIRPQSDFTGVSKCRTYRFETGFDNIIADLADRWKVPRPDVVPHSNATEHQALRIDTGTRKLIDRFYAVDFETLNYPTAMARTSMA
ncbi:sulfotransferase family 2 domain-containing protein [Yoonia sp.]|uniref:sulfotransferase family 2 domain-containing protein n=1 Tax=Yoonia sp. TaxID=2212373 RepID=UPI0035C7FCFB